MRNAVDKEQIDLLKKFWRDYGKMLLIAVVIGLVIGSAWQYWQGRINNHRLAASEYYQQYLTAQTSKDIKQSRALAKALKSSYSDTPYAVSTALWQAKIAVNNKNYSGARDALLWVIQHGHVPVEIALARLRLARVNMQVKQYDQALLGLKQVTLAAFAPIAEKLTGDIYRQQGDNQRAMAAYQKAKVGYQKYHLSPAMLTMAMQSIS